jgi:hypothetical protein
VLLEEVDQLREVAQRAAQSVDFVDRDRVDEAGLDIAQQTLERRAFDACAGEPAIVVSLGECDPSVARLARDVGLDGLALRIERVERLVEAVADALARVDRDANRACEGGCGHEPLLLSTSPKNNGPLQTEPVTTFATALSDR